jgi:hypothetical protein
MTQEEFDKWVEEQERKRFEDYEAPELGIIGDTGRIDPGYDGIEDLPVLEVMLMNIKREPVKYLTYTIGALALFAALDK